VLNASEPFQTQTAPAQTAQTDKTPPDSQNGVALVSRAGRYTLIELGPDDAQRALMQQLVQTSIPVSMDATVGDGLRFLLSRTGYRICDEGHDVWALDLFALPLPAAHYRLGPMTLRQALLTLIGPAWTLQVNEARRQVCVTPIDAAEYRQPVSTGVAAASSPAPRPADIPTNSERQP
jgi:type IV pili sensor histidine kinase/response regulator